MLNVIYLHGVQREVFMDQKIVDRINELAHKKKTVGLTDEELEEQARLRAIFLEDFRKRFIAQLENIEIVDEDDPRLKSKKGPLS